MGDAQGWGGGEEQQEKGPRRMVTEKVMVMGHVNTVNRVAREQGDKEGDARPGPRTLPRRRRSARSERWAAGAPRTGRDAGR